MSNLQPSLTDEDCNRIVRVLTTEAKSLEEQAMRPATGPTLYAALISEARACQTLAHSIQTW